MKIEKISVMNVENALRGMRNPMNSWAKSDSIVDNFGNVIVGSKDKELARKLIKAGSEHRKFMRQIFVSMDVTAPLYWWKEASTYKVGTVANSTSTMHKIHTKPIELSDFETDDYEKDLEVLDSTVGKHVEDNIKFLEDLRKRFLETKDIRYWKELIRWLPDGYLQTRTVTMSFENVLNIYKQRKGHKLTEWHTFIDAIKTMPHTEDFLFYDND